MRPSCRLLALLAALFAASCVVPMKVDDIVLQFVLPDRTSSQRIVTVSADPLIQLESATCVNAPRLLSPYIILVLLFDTHRVTAGPSSVQLSTTSGQRQLRGGWPDQPSFARALEDVRGPAYAFEGECDDLEGATVYIRNMIVDGRPTSFGPVAVHYKYGSHTEYRHFNNDPR